MEKCWNSGQRCCWWWMNGRDRSMVAAAASVASSDRCGWRSEWVRRLEWLSTAAGNQQKNETARKNSIVIVALIFLLFLWGFLTTTPTGRKDNGLKGGHCCLSLSPSFFTWQPVSRYCPPVIVASHFLLHLRLLFHTQQGNLFSIPPSDDPPCDFAYRAKSHLTRCQRLTR